jgi:peptide/nickel transport system permease protein
MQTNFTDPSPRSSQRHSARHSQRISPRSSKLRSALRALTLNGPALIGCLLLVLFALCALLAPWLAPHDPAQLDLSRRLLPPSASHWFGTDELGRDVLSRTLYGARVSLTVAVAVVGLSLTVGVAFGMAAGFYGGLTDTIVNVYLTNAFLALPGILLAVAFVAFLGPSLVNLIIALALSGWVNYARLVRAQVMAMKEREFVQAARSLGAGDLRLMLRHILPNIVQPLLVQAAVGMAAAVLAEATLSFLGLGVQPPTATWGAMLNDARSHLFESPYLVFFPAMAVALCVLSFNLLGDGLRDFLDPRTRLRLNEESAGL